LQTTNHRPEFAHRNSGVCTLLVRKRCPDGLVRGSAHSRHLQAHTLFFQLFQKKKLEDAQISVEKAALDTPDATTPYSLSQRPVQAGSGRKKPGSGFKALVIIENLPSVVLQLNRN
jgi:hypothetical protein